MSRLRYALLQGEKDIRILKLAPRESCTDPAGELLYVNLSDKPEYSALSYVWGTELDHTPFECNKSWIEVTKNLKEALKHLQYNTEPRFVWIDALCIDQDNLTEKNEQVVLMKEIYACATDVIVWLGPDNENIASEVFTEIDFALSQIKRAINCNLVRAITKLHPAWDKIVILFKSEWFTRTWTIQEVGLTYRPIALWGRSTINFNKIGLFSLSCLKDYRAIIESPDQVQDIERAANVYQMYLPQPGPKRLHYILEEARSYRAGDPRDKVYAFMSHPSAHEDAGDYPHHKGIKPREDLVAECIEWRNLALVLAPTGVGLNYARLPYIKNQSPRPPSPDAYSARRLLHSKPKSTRELSRYWPGPSFIKPDYSHSLVQVYGDLTIQTIKQMDSIEILSFVQHENSLPLYGPDFPSWIPRWDINPRSSILGRVTCDHIAAANRCPVITPSPDPGALIVRGIFFDRVDFHTITLSSDDFTNLLKTSPVFSMSSHCQVSEYPIPIYPQIPVFPRSGSDRMVAFRQTWTAGRTKATQEAPSNGFDPERDFAAYQLDFMRRRCDGLEASSDRMESLCLDEGAEQGQGNRFAHAAASVCHQRRFFITKSGFFGIGPAVLEQEDYVCVLFGSDVPFLLRETKRGGYSLLGESYVHGIMQGQVVRAWGEGGDLKDILLC